MESLDQLPSALLATILMKLDVPSICSAGSTCKSFKDTVSHVLSCCPNFHLLDIAPTLDLLRPLLPPNPSMRSLKLDCYRLDDSAIDLLLHPSLQELFLVNCKCFSSKLLSEIGAQCKNLKSLHLGSATDNYRMGMRLCDLEKLLTGCTQLEALALSFDVSLFKHPSFSRVWETASRKISSLEIGFITSEMVSEFLSPRVELHQQHYIRLGFPNIQKLCLSVDCITDAMVETISRGLVSLTHLELRDAPVFEPPMTSDLTNSGLQLINQHGKLKHLSLVRSTATYFNRVNDLGILLMADKCACMESIYLCGFCRVTDAGFKTILHSCPTLRKLRVAHGPLLTDLVFHDVLATSLSLTHVSLRFCNLLRSVGVKNLVSNMDLRILDLRDCKHLGDEALRAIGTLCKLKVLQLDGSDISDIGLSYLRWRVISSLTSLSLRGCRRLTDKGISTLVEGSSKLELQDLDLSNLPNLTDNGVLALARNHIQIIELRLRQCPLISDISVMALASMHVGEDGWQGSQLRLLDLYNCGGITPLSFRWLRRPYFPRLRRLGLTGVGNWNMVDDLGRSRPLLHVACRGEELCLDTCVIDANMHEYIGAEFEQWLHELEDSDEEDEEMEDAENDGDVVV